MDRAQFWSLIEETKSESGGDCDRQVELLQKRLASRSEKEIVAFEQLLEELLHEAYTWKLWAAGYLINGGCSDDGFEYFRLWLIAQGEQIYGNAVKDPESLADFPREFPESVECEELGYVAMEAYVQKTAHKMNGQLAPGPREPRGKKWDEDAVDQVLPRLAERVKDRWG